MGDNFENSQDTSWTTRIPPEQTRPFGVAELHTAVFQPAGWSGQRPTISLTIPEGRLVFAKLSTSGVPVATSFTPEDKSIKHCVRIACNAATEWQACLVLGCDTAAQAERAAKLAARLLPKHERVALERMEDPAARCRADLN